MNRTCLLLTTFTMFAGVAHAQCFTSSGASQLPLPNGSNDDGETDEIPLGFTFPMAGVATTLTHAVVETNGCIYLTDGSGVVDNDFDVDSLAELRGAAGASPRILAYGNDLEVTDLLIDTSVAGEFKVTWVDTNYFSLVPPASGNSWSVTIFSSGNVEFSYGYGVVENLSTTENAFTGISIGDEVGTGTETESDLFLGADSGTLGLLFAEWDRATEYPLPIRGNSILIVPNGNGGFTSVLSCGSLPNPPASHTPAGSGCYPIAQFGSWYQEFGSVADAEATLENQAIVYAPNANGGYTAAYGSLGALRPTTAASPLALADDQLLALALPQAFNWYGTSPGATLFLSSNGWIGDATQGFSIDFNDGGDFDDATVNAIAAYGHDLDPEQGGAVYTEYDAGVGVFYITFEDIQDYDLSGSSTNVATFQYQLDLAAGVCTVVYGDIVDGGDTATRCVGQANVGPLADQGGLDVTTDLPFSTFATELMADGISLTADVPAVSTATTGTSVTYASANAPDFAPTALPGLKVGVIIGSFGAPVVPGIDLGFLSAPGCAAHVASLDAVEALDPAGNFTLPYPAGVPPLTSLTFQMAFLFDTNDSAYPSSLAGQNGNTFVMTSNALVTTISDN